MNIGDFSAHPVWQSLSTSKLALEQIEADSENESDYISRITTINAHLNSFTQYQSELTHLFVPKMLDYVFTEWSHCENYIQSRLESGSGHADLLLNAMNHAEEALFQAANWPVPLAKGAQLGRLRSLFEDVAEAQAKQVQTHKNQEKSLISSYESSKALLEDAEKKATEAIAKLDTEFEALDERIEGVLKQGSEKIEELEDLNNASFKAWKETVGEDAKKRLQELVSESADSNNEAKSILEKLKAQAGEYANIASASTASLLAGHYGNDAKTNRIIGIGSYALGLLIVGLGALPLISASLQANSATTFDITKLIPRIVLALVSGSVAAVFWKLGSRFLGRAEVAKDYELQLRTIGPFLANVDKARVDQVRLNFVNRKYAEDLNNSADQFGNAETKEETNESQDTSKT